MGLISRIPVGAAAAAFATTALAQTVETALPPGMEWAVSPASILVKSGWGRSVKQANAERGAVLVKCAYDAKGALSKCQALDGRPAGFFLGASAVAVARRARLKPTLIDGSSLTPGSVTFIVMLLDADRLGRPQEGTGPGQTAGLPAQTSDRGRNSLQATRDRAQAAIDRDPRATNLGGR